MDTMTPNEVRAELIRALRLDLVGPGTGEPYDGEALPQAPSRWYLSGFLVPYEAPAEQREDEQGQEQLDLSGAMGATDDDETPEPASARRAFFPSSVGLSVLVPADARTATAIIEWGDYRRTESEEVAEAAGVEKAEEGARIRWVREQRRAEVVLSLAETSKPVQTAVPESDGLRLYTSVRAVASAVGGDDGFPGGTRAVSVFLVNHREPKDGEQKDEAFAFQVRLTLGLGPSFVPRPNLRGLVADEWDEQVADLQYRDAFEFAVGHGVAAEARVEPSGECHEVATTWLPAAEVEKVEPSAIPDVELGMEALVDLASAEAIREQVGGLVARYRAWIDAQAERAPREGRRGQVAKELLNQARAVADRIEKGLDCLGEPDVFGPFAWGAAPRIAAKLGARGLLGVAGTGTAISSLSGAALTSASLAALGGGLGMAGGAVLLTAAGAGLGACQGALVSNAYFGQVQGFGIQKIRDGIGPALIVIDGFLSQGNDTTHEWIQGVAGRYGASPLYRVQWESKRLADLGKLVASHSARSFVSKLTESLAERAAKSSSKALGRIGTVVSLARNPWHVAMVKASMTGILLADLMARTRNPEGFIVMGHSLGARVTYYLLAALSTKDEPLVRDAYLLGGAVGRAGREAWESATKSVSGTIYNCHSANDSVLRYLYRTTTAFASEPVGLGPIDCASQKIRDMDVSDLVDSHTEYKMRLGSILGRLHPVRSGESNA